jgi:Zn-dependent M28 family amino/carboxypeptidase
MLAGAVLLGAMLTASCEQAPAEAPEPAGKAKPAPTPAQPAQPLAAARINPGRTMRYVKDIIAYGPRPIGSDSHKKVEAYILRNLKGDQVEDDAFVADTPAGKLPVRNLIAQYPGTKDGIIVIAGHYDTNTSYIGANDGGSSSAMLLELANHLRGKKRDGYSVWLVWTDGEEAVRVWTQSDSLYGTKHLADRWQKDGTLKKIKAFILLDMIGDADLNIEKDANSTPWLQDLVLQAATTLGHQSHFFGRSIAVEDDHLPFARLGVPVIDLIDLDYGYGDVFHHTTQDSIDKLDTRSLAIVGNVVLQTIGLLDQR